MTLSQLCFVDRLIHEVFISYLPRVRILIDKLGSGLTRLEVSGQPCGPCQWHIFYPSWPQQSISTTHAFVEKYIDRAIALHKDISTGETSTDDASHLLRRTLIWHMAAKTDDREFIRTNIMQALMVTLDTSSVLVSNMACAPCTASRSVRQSCATKSRRSLVTENSTATFCTPCPSCAPFCTSLYACIPSSRS
jgi:hypothetical protein